MPEKKLDLDDLDPEGATSAAPEAPEEKDLTDEQRIDHYEQQRPPHHG